MLPCSDSSNTPMTWLTFGHQTTKNILEKQLDSGQLPHAYLFVGPDGVGKKHLALEFAGKILKAKTLNNHPDFRILDGETEISIEQARNFIANLSFKPFLGAKKLAIINNAENLNSQSSNALLKTLEEPGQSNVIILIANSGGLLPTIVSRCQVLNFNSLSSQELKEFAENNRLGADEKILDLSFGRIGRLVKLRADKNFLAAENEAVEKYRGLKALSLAEKLAEVGEMAEMEPMEMKKSFTSWLLWQANQLQHRPKEFVCVQAIIDAISALKRNQNKKLVLQKLLMTI